MSWQDLFKTFVQNAYQKEYFKMLEELLPPKDSCFTLPSFGDESGTISKECLEEALTNLGKVDLEESLKVLRKVWPKVDECLINDNKITQ